MRSAPALLFFLSLGCAFDGTTLPEPAWEGARCERDGPALRCRHRTLTIATGVFGLSAREVHFEVPEGEPPPDGWPTAILFQGSFHSAQGMWESTSGEDFGGEQETELVSALLEAGIAVVTPETRFDGSTYWDSNVLPFALEWEIAEDHQLMEALLAHIADGTLGPLNPRRLLAAGISSGGYMTSRMAVSYPGRFRALAIQSGSYATCAGPVCTLPETMPADHPPTMFLHGDADLVVPLNTMQAYASALERAGVTTEQVIEPGEGHAWMPSASSHITRFFLSHLQSR